MTDADAQAVESAMAEQTDSVAQAVLAAMAAVELEPCHAGRQVQLVVRQQRFFRFDLPEALRRGDRFATEVHEGGGLEQPYRLAGDIDLGGLAEQLAVHAPARAGLFDQGVNETKPGIVPGLGVLGSGVAQTNDQSQSCHYSSSSVPALCRYIQKRRLPRRTGAAITYSAAGASSAASSLPSLAVTIASSWSLPWASAGISTPFGSLMSDR